MAVAIVDIVWTGVSLLVAAGLAARGVRRKSLSPSGALAGFLVTFATMLSGFRFGGTLIIFYLTASRLTKYKAERKAIVEDGYKEGGQRVWQQVLANTILGTAICVALVIRTRWQDLHLDATSHPVETALLGGFLGHYATCTGDTWSSEVGIVADAQPRLITTWRAVPPGTNGGITWVGTAASAAGGGLIGVFFFLSGLVTAGVAEGSAHVARQLLLIPLGTWAGLVGSLADSLLGATLQFSGFCSIRKKVVEKPGPSVKRISGADVFGNSMINFLSIFVTTCITAAVALQIFR